MPDDKKTKAQLISELKKLRRRVSKLEKTGPIHKLADKALSFYKSAVEGSRDLMAAVDRNYIYLFANKAYLGHHQLAKEKVIGHHFGEVLGKSYFKKNLKPYMDRCLNGEILHFETTYTYPSKGECYLEAWYYPLRDEDGGIQGLVGIARDITDRKRSEEALRRSEERYRTFVLESIDGVWCVELDVPCPTNLPESEQIQLILNNRIVECNQAMALMYGFQCAEELIGQSLSDFISEEVAVEVIQTFIKADYRITNVETEEEDRSGKTLYFMNNSFGIIIDGVLVRFWGTQQDITERKQMEQNLKEANDIINRSSSVAVTWRNQPGWPVEYVTENVEKIFGYKAEEFMSGAVSYESCVHPDDLERVALEVETFSNEEGRTEFIHEPYRAITKDGLDKVLSDWTFIVRGEDGKITHYKGIIEDITKRQQAEEEKAKLAKQLRRAQKLETIGTLAGGIAHDFNNILTPIIGYTDMALSKLTPSNPLYDDLNRVIDGANRAKDLVQQILIFNRQAEQERKPLKLHLIIKEAIKLLRSSIPSTIEIRHRIDTTCEKVLADASQIHQVFINLCTNSFHAMEQKGGVLTIKLKEVEIDADTAQSNPHLEQKKYVCLTVSDTGIGMDEDILDRIFEPFFTTKDVNKGTGLGLSVVHGIIRSHHGEIIVYSDPGKGSTFHVYLPVSTATASDIEIKKVKTIQGGGEHILVVDDEESVVTMLKRILEEYGYKVETRNSSIEGFKRFCEQPEKYDLVISDLTMPTMTGLELAKELRDVRSELPVIIMTGYGENISEEIFDYYGINKIVAKPIDIKKLILAIQMLIEK